MRERTCISLEGVSKSYGENEVLSPLDLAIYDGEFFCLLGPSGSGKTTTLNLIGGFVSPTRGTIRIRDERVDQLPPYKRPVNTVFQSYALFPHMSVHDNVAFGLRMAKIVKSEIDQRVRAALNLVHLDDYAGRLPAELSGGQQQRVAVARAVVKRPEVLLLDEPLGALDLKLRHQLQNELARIHREIGTTFVYVTHDQGEAMMLADRIAVMNGGKIEQIGTPEEIYLTPRSRFVADFIGDSNILEVEYGLANGLVKLADDIWVACERARDVGEPRSGHVMIRPELISFDSNPGEVDPGIQGRVLETTFLGPTIHVLVDCDISEQPIAVTLSRHSHLNTAPPDKGSRVSLRWHPRDAVLLETRDD